MQMSLCLQASESTDPVISSHGNFAKQMAKGHFYKKGVRWRCGVAEKVGAEE